MSKHIDTVTFQIGDADVLLRAGFDFSPYQPATGPSYACGGTASIPASVEITSLEWSRDNKKTHTYDWQKIEGPLFDLIAEDKWLHYQLRESVEAEMEDA
jgi:hypothetical protein